MEGYTHHCLSLAPLQLCCYWVKFYCPEKVFPGSQWTQDLSLALAWYYLLGLRLDCIAFVPPHRTYSIHHLFLTVIFKTARYKICNKNRFFYVSKFCIASVKGLLYNENHSLDIQHWHITDVQKHLMKWIRIEYQLLGRALIIELPLQFHC